MKIEDDTLKIFNLIISNDEVEYEASNSVTDYLIKRASEYANRLGRQKYKIKDSGYIVDPLSNDHRLIYYCERDFT
jgi:hypothetical protein